MALFQILGDTLSVLNWHRFDMGGSMMEETEMRLRRSEKIRRTINLMIAGIIVMGAILYFAKLPINMAGWFVLFKVESPSYIPLNVEDSYSKVVGFNKVKIVYENQDGSFTTWATSKIGWNNVSSWDEKITLENGTTAYYTETDDVQMISWIKDKVEYAIDYSGDKSLSKDELIKMASSIK